MFLFFVEEPTKYFEYIRKLSKTNVNTKKPKFNQSEPISIKLELWLSFIFCFHVLRISMLKCQLLQFRRFNWKNEIFGMCIAHENCPGITWVLMSHLKHFLCLEIWVVNRSTAKSVSFSMEFELCHDLFCRQNNERYEHLIAQSDSQCFLLEQEMWEERWLMHELWNSFKM